MVISIITIYFNIYYCWFNNDESINSKILINATPLGMFGKYKNKCPVSKVFLKKNKLVYDGGLLKRYYYKNNNPTSLEIKFDMFGRFKKNKTYKALINPGRSLYDLYLLGYKDAQNNHELLKKYF